VEELAFIARNSPAFRNQSALLPYEANLIYEPHLTGQMGSLQSTLPHDLEHLGKTSTGLDNAVLRRHKACGYSSTQCSRRLYACAVGCSLRRQNDILQEFCRPVPGETGQNLDT